MLIDFEGRAIENYSSAGKVERSYLIEEADVVNSNSVVHQYQIDAVQVGSKHFSVPEIKEKHMEKFLAKLRMMINCNIYYIYIHYVIQYVSEKTTL